MVKWLDCVVYTSLDLKLAWKVLPFFFKFVFSLRVVVSTVLNRKLCHILWHKSRNTLGPFEEGNS